MLNAGKRNVLGILINVADYDGAVDFIARAARDRTGIAVSALAVHGLMTGVFDREQKFRLNHFDLLVPDGAVGHQQIEMIEAEFLFAVEDTGHQAMNREGGDGNSGAVAGGAGDEVHGAVVVGDVDQNTKDVALAGVKHWSFPRSSSNSIPFLE